MKQTPKVNDVFKGDERFVHGFKFPSGLADEPVQIGGAAGHPHNASDESRKKAMFRILRVEPFGNPDCAHGSFGYRIVAVRLDADMRDNPDGEQILFFVGRPDPLEIVGSMKLVFQPASEWPEPEPKDPPPFLHRCC